MEVAENLKRFLSEFKPWTDLSHNGRVFLSRSLFFLSASEDWRLELIRLSRIWDPLSDENKTYFFRLLLSLFTDDTSKPDKVKELLKIGGLVPTDYSSEQLMLDGVLLILLPEEQDVPSVISSAQQSFLLSLANTLLGGDKKVMANNRILQDEWVSLRYLLYLSDLFVSFNSLSSLQEVEESHTKEPMTPIDKMAMVFSDHTHLEDAQSTPIDKNFVLKPTVMSYIVTDDQRRDKVRELEILLHNKGDIRTGLFFDGCLKSVQGEMQFLSFLVENSSHNFLMKLTREQYAQYFMVLLNYQLDNRRDVVFSTMAYHMLASLVSTAPDSDEFFEKFKQIRKFKGLDMLTLAIVLNENTSTEMSVVRHLAYRKSWT